MNGADLGDDDKEAGGGRCTWCCFACAVCRIICYTVYRRVCSCCIQSPPPPKQEFTVLCLGLEGSGKTSLLTGLAGEPVDRHTSPPSTMGFSIKAIVTENAILNTKELGGAAGIQIYWERYFSDHNGLIFVIDSTSSQEQLLESKLCLSRCLGNPALHGLPVLLVCSKNDLPAAKPVMDVEEVIKDELEGRKWIILGTSWNSVKETKKELEVFVDMLLEKPSNWN